MRLSLIPRDYHFYELLHASAKNLVEAGAALLDLMEHYQNVDMKLAHIRELEHKGLSVIISRRQCLEAAKRTKGGAA